MALKIRLSRGGSKRRPYYKIIIANSQSPRDGKFIDIVGSYNPISNNLKDKISINTQKIYYWLKIGAKPTKVVDRFLHNNENTNYISKRIARLREKSTALKTKIIKTATKQ